MKVFIWNFINARAKNVNLRIEQFDFNLQFVAPKPPEKKKINFQRDFFNQEPLLFMDIININGLFDRINIDFFVDEFKDNYLKLIDCAKTNNDVFLIKVPLSSILEYQLNKILMKNLSEYMIQLNRFFFGSFFDMIVYNLIGNVLKIAKSHNIKGYRWKECSTEYYPRISITAHLFKIKVIMF
jgi:hypothetical protein